jgi:hypothetical protein
MKLRYEICSPIRILLPISGVLITLPVFLKDELINYITIPIFYFFGTYFIFVNFPSVSEKFQQKPIYLEDLADNSGIVVKNKFKNIYGCLMNFVLAILFASFAEYVIIQGIRDKAIVEIMAIVGGNLALYVKTQQTIGKVLLKICHCLKEKEVKRKQSIEMDEV